MSSETLDLKDPDNWREKNSQKIAEQLGFEYNKDFEQAFLRFLKLLASASVHEFLISIAINSFKKSGCISASEDSRD